MGEFVLELIWSEPNTKETVFTCELSYGFGRVLLETARRPRFHVAVFNSDCQRQMGVFISFSQGRNRFLT